MAILHGYINLSKIDKNLITTNKSGDKIIWVDVYTYDTPDQFGNTACLAQYDPRTRQKTYLANFRKKELHQENGSQGDEPSNDLGF